MKIQIIGLGVVGSAQAYLLASNGHTILAYDPYLTVLPPLLSKFNSDVQFIDEIQGDVDATFICAPEAIVENLVSQLAATQTKGLIVIKSTVPIGETRRLMQKYGVHISHNPEFLRENKSFDDIVNPSRIVIGACCEDHKNLLTTLYGSVGKPLYVTDSTTSETAKLVANCIRAVTITFWNDLFFLCEKTGANIKDISEISDTAKVIGEYEGGKWGQKFFGEPYTGKCLPKDMKQLIKVFQSNGLNSHILEASEQSNAVLLKDKS